MDLARMGEFGFLQRARTWTRSLGAVVGPGDDAAVVPAPDGYLVATTDVLVEGTHFRCDWSTPADIGYKAVTVNVSDLAAMGAEPRWILLGLGAPGDTDEPFLQGLYAGLQEACERYGCEVIGGDTVRSDRLQLTITALGSLDGPPLTRSGARIGDVVAVTGPLGRSAAGVNLLLAQNHRGADPSDVLACILTHQRPVARVAEGRALRLAGAHAGMDVSDGVASDAYRLAEASGVGIEIDADLLPVAPEVRRIGEPRGWDVVRLALSGGEDFELLVAVADAEAAGTPLIPIGRIVSEGVWLVSGGERRPMPETGWDHFRAPQ